VTRTHVFMDDVADEQGRALPSKGEVSMPLTIDGTLYYTTTEAAHELGVQPTSLRKVVANGTIAVRYVEELGRNLIAADELERYRAERAGQKGWTTRKDPSYQPTNSRAAYFRAYRQRKRQEMAEQAHTTTDTETGAAPMIDTQTKQSECMSEQKERTGTESLADAPTTPEYNELLDADQARIVGQRDELEERDRRSGHGARGADEGPLRVDDKTSRANGE